MPNAAERWCGLSSELNKTERVQLFLWGTEHQSSIMCSMTDMWYDKIDIETVGNSYVCYEKEDNGSLLKCGTWDHLMGFISLLHFWKKFKLFEKYPSWED